MKSLAIIPARSGSKRLPGKNVLPLDGKPLLAWTIEAAQQSNIFHDIFVSTNSKRISEVAKQYNSDVLERPESLATDSSSCAEVCLWHLKQLANLGSDYDVIYCLYPTAPLRTAKDLQEMHLFFHQHNKCDAVIAVTNYSHYPYQAFSKSEDSKISSFWPNLCRQKSNVMPNLVAGNGSSYAIKVKKFVEIGDFYSSSNMNIYSHFMPFFRSIDIDTFEDFALLEAIYSNKLHLINKK